MVAGQALIVLVFGQEWQLAGLYAQIMAPSLIFWTVANPLSSLPLVGKRERESLAFTVGELAAKVLSLGIGVAVNSLTVGIVALSITSLAIELAATWRFLRVASVSLGELARPVLRVVALTLPFLVIVVLAEVGAPLLVPIVAVLAWAGAFAFAVRATPEARTLMSGHL
jgi:O-antigen/teichoic acid export membrane protein